MNVRPLLLLSLCVRFVLFSVPFPWAHRTNNVTFSFLSRSGVTPTNTLVVLRRCVHSQMHMPLKIECLMHVWNSLEMKNHFTRIQIDLKFEIGIFDYRFMPTNRMKYRSDYLEREDLFMTSRNCFLSHDPTAHSHLDIFFFIFQAKVQHEKLLSSRICTNFILFFSQFPILM